MAVPFFFIVSGFLLGNKMDISFMGINTEVLIKKYLLKIIKMYLIWTAIYFPLAVYHFISSDTSLIKAVLLYVRGVVFLGDQYNSWPLWYLLSTIYALIFILFLVNHKKNIKAILCVVGAFFLISILITYFTGYDESLPTYVLIIQKILKWTIGNGRILTGMFYIPVGMYLSKEKLSDWVSWLLMIGGGVYR